MARILPFKRKPTLVQSAQAQAQQSRGGTDVASRRLHLIVRGWARVLGLRRGQRVGTDAGEQGVEVEGLGCA